jgi:hypothetical protein
MPLTTKWRNLGPKATPVLAGAQQTAPQPRHLICLIELYRANCERKRTTPAIAMTAAKANTTAASGATSDRVA